MSSRIVQRTLVGIAVCATTLVGAGAGPAVAGEITGSGRSLKTVPTGNPAFPFALHGKSICAFSGLNDEYVEADDEDKEDFARVQTPAEAPPGVAGVACNPSGARG